MRMFGVGWGAEAGRGLCAFHFVAIGFSQARTRTEKGSLSPKWLKDVTFPVMKEENDMDVLNVSVFNDDGKNADGTLIGFCTITLTNVILAGTTLERYKLTGPDGMPAGEVCLIMRYVPRVVDLPPETDAYGQVRGDDGMLGAGDPGKLGYYGGKFGEDLVGAAEGYLTGKADSIGKVVSDEVGVAGSLDSKAGSKGNSRSRFFSILGAIVAVVMTAMAVGKGQRQARYYEVQEGDTLCAIAGCYNMTPDLLYEANLEVTDDPDRIYPGDRIFIP
ncbi:hypothetical protein CBR_g22961 [Chara braunii]|uniref:Uncharacterized protein n=1 Tax=Chara braunii TaxID=69332 RepID=A0A388L362_CHABU|nr:hypothetical protein CBR_g22961 [Chara braunii]|eukprot:GBG76745.1 hypothetical protein CBR_g22961 [Chara braunii]